MLPIAYHAFQIRVLSIYNFILDLVLVSADVLQDLQLMVIL